MGQVGIVEELRRYPVKSMIGEMLDIVDVLPRGLVGDRLCGLIDIETGKVATAKLPHRWRRMLEFRAFYRAGPVPGVEIEFPDGRRLDCLHPDIEAMLSAELKREVRVALDRPDDVLMDRANPDEVATAGNEAEVETAVLPLGMGAPEGGFFDYAPLHVVTTGSLEEVGRHSLAGVAEPVRFRPNLVVRTTDSPAFVENGWVGGHLSVGSELILGITLPTPRCAVPTLAHGSTVPDPRLTTNIGKLNKVQVLDMGQLACLGAYAEILRPGTIRLGDPVMFEPA